MLNQDLDKGIQAYSEAIRLNPNDAEAYYRRGLKRQANNDLDGAISDYSQTLRLNPHHTAAYCGRGILYEKRGDLARANADYQQHIDLGGRLAEVAERRMRDNEGRMRGEK